MKQKWFWVTLAFWTIFAVSVFSWALIFAPVRYDPQPISHFQVEMNGSKQDTQIWRNEGDLKQLLPVIVRSWEKDGWKQTCPNTDLAPALLGLEDRASELESRVKLLVFQKKGLYRTLGLWGPNSGEQTYGWVSEVPDAAFDQKIARDKWDLPLHPPSGATDLYCQGIKNFEMGIFSLPPQDDFPELCAQQGFQVNLWRRDRDGETYVLTKGRYRLLAALISDGVRRTVSLSSFNH